MYYQIVILVNFGKNIQSNRKYPHRFSLRTNLLRFGAVLPYEITVTTGDKMNSGTDANVMMQLYGEDGKSEVIQLRSRTDNFERNAVDKFKVRSR